VTNYDPMKQLQDAGVPVDKLSEEQRKQLQSLSPNEIAVLGRIQERMAGDVQGYLAGDTGWVIY
jgi:hypothetical protein